MFVQPHFDLVNYQPGENIFFGEELTATWCSSLHLPIPVAGLYLGRPAYWLQRQCSLELRA
jgi:hypothetical protein